MLTHQLEIVHHHEHGAPFAMPVPDERDQIGGRLGVDGVERFVEQDQIGLLHEHAGKERALQLAAGQGVDRSALEAGQADRGERVAQVVPVLAVVTPQKAAFRPKSETNQVENAGWKAAVDLGLLRQIGKPLAGCRLHGAGHRFHDADDPFHQGGFARSVGADHRGQRTTFDGAVQMVDGRVAVIAEGQVAKGQAGVAHCHVRGNRRR
jgi:hypothetical protein